MSSCRQRHGVDDVDSGFESDTGSMTLAGKDTGSMTLSFQHPHPAFVDEFTKPALVPMEEAFRVFQVRQRRPLQRTLQDPSEKTKGDQRPL